jgi:tRNA acetyltransferase TAN1
VEADEKGHNDPDDGEVEEDLEKQIAKELAVISRPRREQRFANCQTNTPCVIFISCKAPVDPVQLVLKHIENVERTGVTHTRYTHRLTPVTNTCVANATEIKSLAQRVLKLFLAQNPDSDYRYKIELKVRNHNTLSRQLLIDTVVSCVPSGWTVNLEDAEVFILVEVFKSTCGIGIVKGYYAHQKFNVMEIANMKNTEAKLGGEGRVTVHQTRLN